MKKDIYKKLEIFHFANTIEKTLPDGKRKCLIFGNFGVMNLGDEAILAGELQELKNIKNLNIQVVTRNPAEIERLHGTDSVSMYNLLSVIKQVNKSDFIIVGGGGIICKTEGIFSGLIYQLYMLFLYFALPVLLNKKIYVLGIGIYDNANPLVLALSCYLLKFAKLLTVRDYHSFNYLKNKKINVLLYKDNSYLMTLDSKSEITRDEFFKKNYNPNKKNVGLALLKPENTSDEDHLLSEIKKMVNKHYNSTNFWFYSCDYQDNYFNDSLFARKIYDEIGKTAEIRKSLIIVPNNLSPVKFFSPFKLMDFFITVRLHAAIFCYRNNIEFLGTTYDTKCSSFLESIGKKPIEISEAKLA